jgi:hypothetical protein
MPPPPTPSPVGECALSLVRGGGAQSLTGKGVGGVPVSTRGQTHWYSRYISTLSCTEYKSATHFKDENKDDIRKHLCFCVSGGRFSSYTRIPYALLPWGRGGSCPPLRTKTTFVNLCFCVFRRAFLVLHADPVRSASRGGEEVPAPV